MEVDCLTVGRLEGLVGDNSNTCLGIAPDHMGDRHPIDEHMPLPTAVIPAVDMLA
jgi:hypothetical protein